MAKTASTGVRKSKRAPTFRTWGKAFLAKLAETSNVTKSATAAGISKTTAYARRRTDPEFNRQWQDALAEGYDHLEMETLARLRSGQLKPAAGTGKTTRTFDNATAIRLLTAHRASVAQSRAQRDNADADAILASLDAKLDAMRKRSLARAAEEVAKKDNNDEG